MRPSRILAVLALFGASLASMPAHADTECIFAGPAPGWRAMRLDLPDGSDFVVADINGKRPTHVVNQGDSWHLAEGILVVNAATLTIPAYRIQNAGTSPPSVVARADGTDVLAQDAAAPDGPFTHADGARPSLAPGSYYVIGFGTGGRGPGNPTDPWSVTLRVAGTHDCTMIGSGETFDYNQSRFGGGTEVYAPGAGVIDGASLTFTTSRRLVVGLIDVATQAEQVGTSHLDYITPTGSGSIDRAIVPFASLAGEYDFTAHVQGAFPVVAVSGVTLDIS